MMADDPKNHSSTRTFVEMGDARSPKMAHVVASEPTAVSPFTKYQELDPVNSTHCGALGGLEVQTAQILSSRPEKEV